MHACKRIKISKHSHTDKMYTSYVDTKCKKMGVHGNAWCLPISFVHYVKQNKTNYSAVMTLERSPLDLCSRFLVPLSSICTVPASALARLSVYLFLSAWGLCLVFLPTKIKRNARIFFHRNSWQRNAEAKPEQLTECFPPLSFGIEYTCPLFEIFFRPSKINIFPVVWSKYSGVLSRV